MLQAEGVRDAAFGCDWVGTPIPFQRCLLFIIATANKMFHLTVGKFVPLSNVTMINVCNVCMYVCMCVCMYESMYQYIYMCVCVCVCVFRCVGTDVRKSFGK